MTTELAPIADATYAVCVICDNRLLVEPGASMVLVHLADGSHAVEPTPAGSDEPPTTEDQPGG